MSRTLKYITLFLCCVSVFLNVSITRAATYSLEDLYHLALIRSEQIKIAAMKTRIAVSQKDEALSDLIPSISAFGYHTRYTDSKVMNGFLLQPSQTNEWGLKAGRSLSLSGSEFTGLSIAKDNILKSDYDLAAMKRDYLFNVAELYYSLLRAKREIEIANANTERLTRQRDAAHNRLEAGTSTRTDLLRAEAELAGSLSDLVIAENNERIVSAGLAKTAGINNDYDIIDPVHGNTDIMTGPIADDIRAITGKCTGAELDCLRQKALHNRAEIKALSAAKTAAAKEVRVARGGYWPDISLEGVYMRQENDPSSTFGLKEKIYGTVKLDFPFFEGGLTRARTAQALARLRQAELNLADRQNEIRVEVEKVYLAVTREASAMQHLSAEKAFAADNYELVKQQFQYGLADSLDLIDANTLLLTAERKFTNTAYAYRLSLLQLKNTTGILLKEVLDNEKGKVRQYGDNHEKN